MHTYANGVFANFQPNTFLVELPNSDLDQTVRGFDTNNNGIVDEIEMDISISPDETPYKDIQHIVVEAEFQDENGDYIFLTDFNIGLPEIIASDHTKICEYFKARVNEYQEYFTNAYQTQEPRANDRLEHSLIISMIDRDALTWYSEWTPGGLVISPTPYKENNEAILEFEHQPELNKLNSPEKK
ncbi:MAG: hypothetical protein ABIH34_06375 [Nanoarchaeota archaeon]